MAYERNYGNPNTNIYSYLILQEGRYVDPDFKLYLHKNLCKSKTQYEPK